MERKDCGAEKETEELKDGEEAEEKQNTIIPWKQVSTCGCQSKSHPSVAGLFNNEKSCYNSVYPRRLAQSVERRSPKPEAVGSIPTAPAKHLFYKNPCHIGLQNPPEVDRRFDPYSACHCQNFYKQSMTSVSLNSLGVVRRRRRTAPVTSNSYSKDNSKSYSNLFLLLLKEMR